MIEGGFEGADFDIDGGGLPGGTAAVFVFFEVGAADVREGEVADDLEEVSEGAGVDFDGIGGFAGIAQVAGVIYNVLGKGLGGGKETGLGAAEGVMGDDFGIALDGGMGGAADAFTVMDEVVIPVVGFGVAVEVHIELQFIADFIEYYGKILDKFIY